MVSWSSIAANNMATREMDAESRRMQAIAQANLADAQAVGLPQRNRAEARLIGTRADFAPGLLASEIAMQQARAAGTMNEIEAERALRPGLIRRGALTGDLLDRQIEEQQQYNNLFRGGLTKPITGARAGMPSTNLGAKPSPLDATLPPIDGNTSPERRPGLPRVIYGGLL